MKKIKLLIAAFLTASLGLLTLNSSAQYSKLFDFSIALGNAPYSSLFSDGTFLYGMTSGNSTGSGLAFKIKPDGTGYDTLMNFGGVADGLNPRAAFVSDGTYLYGMTTNGGIYFGNGTIFKIKPDGTGYVKLYDLGYTPSGATPGSDLVIDGTTLYGTTTGGGTSGYGVVFKINTDGTGYGNIHEFSVTDGSSPYGSVIYDGTYLYGMTTGGGANNKGTLYKVKPDGTGFLGLLDFAGITNGRSPQGALFSDGTFLYGMTLGGANGKGTIFKILTDGTGYVKLLDFAGTSNGSTPKGSLISDGTFLYGYTSGGGANTYGTIFKIKPDGSSYTDLYDFATDPDGNGPQGGHLIFVGNCLYGMTLGGGVNYQGTIFKYCLAANGIAENNMQTDFTISPNPGSGIFNLKMTGLENLKVKNMEVYNVIGEKVYQSQINNPQTEIDLSSQPEGIYFLHLQTEQGIAVKKIIISQ